LYRFDGSRFVAWDDASDASLPASAVTSVCVTRNGNLWVGFSDGAGVREFDGTRVLTRDHGVHMSGSVTDIVEDRTGTIWAVIDGVLYSLRNGTWRKASIPWRETSGRVLQAYVSRSGGLWIATRWGVFRHLDTPDTFVPEANGFIWGVSEDAAGTFWTTDI